MATMKFYKWDIVMHVHDEIIIEELEGYADLEQVLNVMSQPIEWAKGLPLRADGYVTDYYKKD